MHADSTLIKALGGPARVAELLNYDKEAGGVQRVHNWMTRGIPPKVKLERPDLFLRPTDQSALTTTPKRTKQEKAAAAEYPTQEEIDRALYGPAADEHTLSQREVDDLMRAMRRKEW